MAQAGLTNIFVAARHLFLFVIQVISVRGGQRRPIIYTKQLSFVASSVQLPFFQFGLSLYLCTLLFARDCQVACRLHQGRECAKEAPPFPHGVRHNVWFYQ